MSNPRQTRWCAAFSLGSQALQTQTVQIPDPQPQSAVAYLASLPGKPQSYLTTRISYLTGEVRSMYMQDSRQLRFFSPSLSLDYR